MSEGGMWDEGQCGRVLWDMIWYDMDITAVWLYEWQSSWLHQQMAQLFTTVWVKKSSSLKLYAILSLTVNCVTKNFLGYIPNIFLLLHQFCSIYLNIYKNCIAFTSLPNFNNSIQFITKFVNFRSKTSHIELYLIKYNS